MTHFKKSFFKKGSAIAYGLVIITAVVIVLTSVIQFVTRNLSATRHEQAKEQSFQIAETGIHFYRWYLAHNTDGKTAQQIKDFWDTGSPYGVGSTFEREYKDEGGTAVGKYTLNVTPPTGNSTITTVTSVGWTYKYPNVKRTIKVRFRRPSWSEYIMLSNSDVRFGAGTDVQGKVFSNSGIRFDGVAHNIVLSAVETYYDNDHDVKAWKPGVWTSQGDESEVFLAGKNYPVPSKDFSSVAADLSLMKTEAQRSGSGNYYYDASKQGRHIILKGDRFDIRTVNSYNGENYSINNYSGGWSTNLPLPDEGVIFVEDNVWVEGTLDGKRLSIVSANLQSSSQPAIFIGMNDLEYADYDGDTTLGLVAEGHINVVKYSKDFLRIDAALLSQSGKVGRDHYNHLENKNTITVYGAIASNERYGFSYSDATGYLNRNLIFDNNLLYSPPPFFPTASQYLIDLWEEL